ncbi:hypothetical protein [uncultured Enorma sp.]|uniref:hypothetical protein n=1 Tax=uncultured Enorma sp. TaxID=1714346 RepID=UPI002595CF11|nr:hypothetical protein [uncultured Enorma sp.]
MALRRSHSGDENIDPFNAPNPVMPSEEPEHESPDPGDGIAHIRQRDKRRRQKVLGAASNSYQPPTYNHDDALPAQASAWQGAGASMDPVSTTAPGADAGSAPIRGGYGAPVQEGSFGAAPSGDDGAEAGTSTGTDADTESAALRHRHRGGRKARGGSAGGDKPNAGARKASCILYLIIFILLSGAITSGAGMLLSSCSAAVGGFFEGIFADDGPRYEDIEPSAPSEVEDAVVSAVQTETKLQLDALIAGESDGVSRFEQGVTDAFQSYCGATPEELGLSAHEIAIWQLSHASYDLSSAYAYLSQVGEGYEGTANVYFDFTTPDITALAFELSAHLPNGYLEPGEAGELTPENLQEIRAAYDAYTAGEPEYEELFSVMDFEAATDLEGGNCAIALDTEAWNEELDWLTM